MDTEHSRSKRKGAIFDAVNPAFGIANVRLAASVFRTFGMSGTGKVWPSFSKQSISLLLFGFFGRDFSKSGLTNFLSSFFRSDIPAILRKCFSVTNRQMFESGKAFKIFKSIVSLVTVYVMHMIGWIKIFHPALCNNAVNEMFRPHKQISLRVLAWGVKGVLSKNFSALRHSVKMVKISVFDAIYGKADHGEPSGVVTVISI